MRSRQRTTAAAAVSGTAQRNSASRGHLLPPRRQGPANRSVRKGHAWAGPRLVGPVRGRAYCNQSLTIGTRLQSCFFATRSVFPRLTQSLPRTRILLATQAKHSCARHPVPISRYFAPHCCSAAGCMTSMCACLASLSDSRLLSPHLRRSTSRRCRFGGCLNGDSEGVAENTSAVQSFCSTGCTAPRNPTPAGARRQLGSPASFGANLLAGFSLLTAICGVTPIAIPARRSYDFHWPPSRFSPSGVVLRSCGG